MPSTMAVFASAHMEVGWSRRSSVVSIHAISPCRPSPTNARSRSPAGQASAAEAKRQTSKPSSVARWRMNVLRRSLTGMD